MDLITKVEEHGLDFSLFQQANSRLYTPDPQKEETFEITQGRFLSFLFFIYYFFYLLLFFANPLPTWIFLTCFSCSMKINEKKTSLGIFFLTHPPKFISSSRNCRIHFCCICFQSGDSRLPFTLIPLHNFRFICSLNCPAKMSVVVPVSKHSLQYLNACVKML